MIEALRADLGARDVSNHTTDGVKRRVRAVRWVRERGGQLRFPETTRATIGQPVCRVSDGSSVVTIEIEGRRLGLLYTVLRHAAGRGQLFWRGLIVVRDAHDAGGEGGLRTAVVVVPRCQIRYPDGRTEPVESHLSIEVVDEHEVFHLSLADLQCALGLAPVSPRAYRWAH